MKKNYEKPQIEAIELEVEDIIQTSGLYDGTITDGLLSESDNNVKDNGATSGGINDWL